MFTNNYAGVSHKVLGFYGNDPVCLFKFFVSSDEPQTANSWSLLSTNFVCFGVISICHFTIFVITSTSSLSRSQGVTGDLVRNRNNRLQRKISFIILTDFLCWVPFIITCFLHPIGLIDASPWYALLSILILPINSVINPLLYDDTVGRIIGRVFRWIRRKFNIRQIVQGLHILRALGYRYTHIHTESLREPGHTTPPVIPDVDREPGHTVPPIIRDVAREPGHTAPPILLDVGIEPGHTAPPILADVARKPGHSTTCTI